MFRLWTKNKLRLTGFYSKYWKLLLIIFFSVAYWPIIFKVPIGYDQGIFAYIGEVIRRGGDPYVDTFDHKGPLLYYLNALGLSLFDSLRGIFIFELIWNCIFIYFSFRLIQKSKPNSNSQYSFSVGLISYILVMMGGNLTETWGFGPQVLSYSIVWFVLISKKNSLHVKSLIFLNLLQSLNLFLCFQLRPNNALGVGFAWLITQIVSIKILDSHSSRVILVNLAFLLTLFISSLTFIYNRGYFKQYIDQYFNFNLDYINQFTLSERILNSLILFSKIYKLPIILFIIVVVILLALGNKEQLKSKQNVVFTTIFAIDVFSAVSGGMPWLHYLIPIIPSAVYLSMSLISVSYFQKKIFHAKVLRVGFTLIIVVSTFLALTSRWYTDYTKESFLNKNSTLYIASKFISDNTSSLDRIYIWGKTPIYQLKPFRYSASSVTYIYPLLINNDNQNTYIEIINRDLIRNKPKYILQASRYCFEWYECSYRYPLSLKNTIYYIRKSYFPIITINQELTVWKLKELNR